MKRIILFAFALIFAIIAKAQEASNEQIQLISFKESKSANGLQNLGVLFKDGWPKDANGENDCAWVRVTFENLTLSDAAEISYNFGNSAPIALQENRLNEAEHEIWLFVTPTEEAYMEASLPKYGKTNRIQQIKLEAKHAYDVILKNNKTLTLSISSKPQGAVVKLENGEKATTPIEFANVPLGTHTITLSLNGRIVKTDQIELSENNTHFEYDLRERKSVTFTSDPKGASLFINGENKGITPLTLELPYDSYSVEARLSESETDTRSITISDISASEIKLEPIKKKTFEVYALYNGNKVAAQLYIDGNLETPTQESYQLTKPIGRSYNMNMTYAGSSKKRKIRVTNAMNVEQEFKLSARNSFVWPWQRSYETAPMGISLAYVSKQLVTKGEGIKYKEDGVWGKENKRLHGGQFGIHFQPCFSFGLGVYTGLFYEYYTSINDDYDLNEFSEHCIYVPTHVLLRIPFSDRISLSVHGGLGFNYSVYGAFGDTDDNYEDYTDFYGETGFPKKFNMASEIAGGLRFGPVYISAQYSKGITNHKSYISEGDFKTTQNKISFSVSYVFSGEN